MNQESAAGAVSAGASPAPGAAEARPVEACAGAVAARRRRAAWLLAAVLLVATFAAYQPVWHAGYIWDDDVMLTGNRHVQSADGLKKIWFSTELPDYFPATSTALWLQWRLWGPNPLGYHLVNVLLHALGALVWWRVLARLAVPGAWLAAALFALHPVNVESVAWITEIKNTLAMLLYALTAWAYLKFEDAGRRRWYGAALVAFALALLSKTAVAPFPVVLLGLAWWRRGRVGVADVGRVAPFFALAVALALVTVWFQEHRAMEGASVRNDGLAARFAGAGWAVWFYLGKALLPVDLAFVYPRWRIEPTNALVYLPSMLVAAALAVGWIYRGRWGRAWLVAFGYFVLLLGPVLGFVNISYMRHSFVADRWQYFAILGPLALLAAVFAVGCARLGARGTQLRAVAATLVLGTLGVLTWRQARIYESSDTLWQATLARNPAAPVAHLQVGTSLLDAEQPDAAIQAYERALALEPTYALAHHNYGCALLKKGEVAAALDRFREALRHQPTLRPAQFYLGRTLLQSGRAEDAVPELQKALALESDNAEAHYHLGSALLQLGRPEAAARSFRQAVALDAALVPAHNDLGVALAQQGERDAALAHFHRVLQLDPNFAEAHVNAGRLSLETGDAPGAVRHYRSALALQPDDLDTLSNLAWVLATWPEDAVRNGIEAIVLAQRASQKADPGDPAILRTLAAAFAEAGRFGEAEAAANRALQAAGELDPAFTELLRGDIERYARGTPVRSGPARVISP